MRPLCPAALTSKAFSVTLLWLWPGQCFIPPVDGYCPIVWTCCILSTHLGWFLLAVVNTAAVNIGVQAPVGKCVSSVGRVPCGAIAGPHSSCV